MSLPDTIPSFSAQAEVPISVKPGERGFVSFIGAALNLSVVGAIVVFFFVMLILRYSGAPLSTLQWAFFLPLLATVVFLPRKAQNRLPFLLASGAVILAAASALDFSGVLRGRLYSYPVYVTRLADDDTGSLSRGLMRALEQSGARVDLVQRSFSSSEEARRWLSLRRDARMIVLSNGNWGDLIVKNDSIQSVIGTPYWWESAARSLQIEPSKDGIVLSGQFGADPLWLITRVDSVTVPLYPPELIGQYLRVLDQALLELASGGSAVDTFRQAFTIDGGWKSSTPMAYAAFLAGTTLAAQTTEPTELVCARRLLEYARGVLRKGANRELARAIEHNSLVLELRSAQDLRRMAATTRALAALSRVNLRDGSVPLVSRAAALNVRVLDRAIGPLGLQPQDLPDL